MVSPETWDLASRRLADGRLVLLGLWGEADAVHMALLNEEPLRSRSSLLKARMERFPRSVRFTHLRSASNERSMMSMD